MGKLIKHFVIIFFVFLYGSANAMSESEHNNYLKLKSLHDEADKELNKIYSDQIRGYEKEGAGFYGQQKSRDVYLKRAQREWIKMRDASCDYETYESQTGTGFASIYEQCLLNKTKDRIKYLKENG
jgi:uncharacterized protein YecT (DUF1311 family)